MLHPSYFAVPPSVIEFEAIRKSYRVNDGEVPALHATNLSIARGEIFGVIGHSGAGKSTLLRLINRLEMPSGGRLRVDGVDVTELDVADLRALRRRIGMIFQHFNLLASKTVAENIAFPLLLAGERNRARIDARINALLARVGLADQAAKYPAQLSGGQKQRVGIARALATEPSILLCDEATSALDPQTTASVLDLLSGLNRELGLTIVLITHEMDVIRRICDRVAVLDAGRVVEAGAVADVFLYPRHETTRRFVREAEHKDDTQLRRDLARIGGRVLRLTFRGDTTYTPLLGRIARETGVDYNILSGRIDRIKHTPYGQLVLALDGGDATAAIARLAEAGVAVEELHA